MIGLCYVLATLALLAVALCGGLVAMLWTANASTETAVAAEKAQEHRGDILEKTIDDDATTPVLRSGGLKRLLSDAGAAPADPSRPKP